MSEKLAGDTVKIRAHKSEPGKGLTYPAFEGILIDDAFDSEGWDVCRCKTFASAIPY